MRKIFPEETAASPGNSVSLFEIDAAVGHAERRSADDVAERHRRKVFEIAHERQCCFDAVLCRGKRARGQIVEIGDAVLVAAEDKEQNGEKERDDLPIRPLGGCRHPHGKADEEIAQDAAQEGVAKAERCLALRDGGHRAGQSAAEERGRVAVNRQRGHCRAAHGIAEVDDAPVAQHLCRRDAPLQQRHHHQAVAREQLAARKDHHGKSRGEHAGGKKLRKRSVLHRHGRSRRADARQRNIGARQHGEQEHLFKGQLRLPLAGGEKAFGDLSRGEHGRISFVFSITTVLYCSEKHRRGQALSASSFHSKGFFDLHKTFHAFSLTNACSVC